MIKLPKLRNRTKNYWKSPISSIVRHCHSLLINNFPVWYIRSKNKWNLPSISSLKVYKNFISISIPKSRKLDRIWPHYRELKHMKLQKRITMILFFPSIRKILSNRPNKNLIFRLNNSKPSDLSTWKFNSCKKTWNSPNPIKPNLCPSSRNLLININLTTKPQLSKMILFSKIKFRELYPPEFREKFLIDSITVPEIWSRKTMISLSKDLLRPIPFPNPIIYIINCFQRE